MAKSDIIKLIGDSEDRKISASTDALRTAAKKIATKINDRENAIAAKIVAAVSRIKGAWVSDRGVHFGDYQLNDRYSFITFNNADDPTLAKLHAEADELEKKASAARGAIHKQAQDLRSSVHLSPKVTEDLLASVKAFVESK